MKAIDDMSKNTQLRAEQGRLRHISQRVISDTVEKYRIDHHYSVVFNKDSASTVDYGHDISNEIINELQHVKWCTGRALILKMRPGSFCSLNLFPQDE